MMKCQEIAEEYAFFRAYGMPHDRAISKLADAYKLNGRLIRRHLTRAQQPAAVTA